MERRNKCPDLWKGDGYSFNVDVYNVGTIAYELATGNIFDYQSSDISKDMIDYIPELKDFIDKATVEDNTKRIKIQELRDHPFMQIYGLLDMKVLKFTTS